MNPSFKLIVTRLKRSRPKLSDETIAEFVMAVKSMTMADILAACKDVANRSGANATETESAVKRRLREVGGKLADFLPYLEEAINEDAIGSASRAIRIPKKSSLNDALAIAQQLLGAQFSSTVTKALDKYVQENDTSYKFKSA